VNTFKKEYPDYEIKILDLNKTEIAYMIKDLNMEWCASKSFNKEKYDEDMESINKFIGYSKFFNTLSIGIFIKGTFIAFTLNELLKNGWAMGHFGKSINSYNKSSCFTEYATSLKLKEMGYGIINIEQDTGLPGLRETKNSYAPDHFLKKYTIKRL
jgi:hypothetical protein